MDVDETPAVKRNKYKTFLRRTRPNVTETEETTPEEQQATSVEEEDDVDIEGLMSHFDFVDDPSNWEHIHDIREIGT